MTDKISLRSQDDYLIVEGSNLDDWENKLFLEVLIGADQFSNGFRIAFDENIFSNVKEILEYFQGKNYEVATDLETQNYIDSIEKENNDYQEVFNSNTNTSSKKIPVIIKRNLKTFQEKAFNHLLAVKNGANFSVPGSGKTSVAYAVFEQLRASKDVEKLFVIGPISSFMPWEDEAEACYVNKPNIARVLGAKKERDIIYRESKNYDIFLCSYQTASNDIDRIIKLFSKYKFMLIVDESHYIKKIQDGVWANTAIKISRFAVRRMILSGTPMPNSLADLWSQFTFLWPGEHVLGERKSYLELIENTNSTEVVREKVRPFIFRVKKQDLALPKTNFNIIKCKMSPYQAQIYRAMAIRFLQQLNIEHEEKVYIRDWRKAKMIRMLQTASNPALLAKYSYEFDVPPLSGEDESLISLIEEYPKYETPGKFLEIQKLVENLIEENEKVVLWTSFIHNIKSLEYLFSHLPIFKVFGEIPKDGNENEELNREQQIREFKKISTGAILIANPAACAESISLHTVSHNAIYLDRTYNAGQYLQSLDRIHRIGSDAEVNYYLLLSENSIDETIQKRLLEKEMNMLKLLDGEFPVGLSSEYESFSISDTDEEELDFQATVDDVQKKYGVQDENSEAK